jgi:D-alanyl-D-alanine carboxypeptidase (penicillin-binding protein 5/6)
MVDPVSCLRSLKWLTILLLFVDGHGGARASAPAFDTAASTAILVDFETGTVLLDREADRPVPPASLTKLMTLEVVFHQLKDGHLRLDQAFTVSPHAWRTGGPASGGSTMFLKPGAQVSITDLISGLAVQSGNDAAVVVAEGVAGSESAFASIMNARAQAVGLTHSRFSTPHGLPDPNERVTMRDMARLAAHLVRAYPEEYRSFAADAFTYNKVHQANRNPVLGTIKGADGLKTGHTAEAGYSLVASAERDGVRLILAMGGLPSAKARAHEARKLLEWGFRSFTPLMLVRAGEAVGQANVFGGAVDKVTLSSREDVKVLAWRGTAPDRFTLRVDYEGPVRAPIRQNDRLGTLVIAHDDGVVIREVPLHASEDVMEGTLLQRTWDEAVEFILEQWRAF